MIQVLIYILGFIGIIFWCVLKMICFAFIDLRLVKDELIKELARVIVMFNIDMFRLNQHIGDIERSKEQE